MSGHIPPSDVISPKNRWTMISVLYTGTAGDYALALGRWSNQPVLGIRWNGNDESRIGNPQSRGLPTWFVVPTDLEDSILHTVAIRLAPEMLALAKSVLGGRK